MFNGLGETFPVLRQRQQLGFRLGALNGCGLLAHDPSLLPVKFRRARHGPLLSWLRFVRQGHPPVTVPNNAEALESFR